ncbi:MAG: ABC transporter substrate-binding protein [bacterium]|nr:ABC transporter substrate-binding protein [bacterium]MXV91153.1 ABC transporter substrate-binding protein [Acidimicrobiia bacterium]MYC44824.1 ABC transporter substrate-binding protein [Acidimicrobiia bacterium]MYI19340.1 ABC transporter substrate-binding protein [Acidimicrobiia bacterium]
MRKLRLTLVLLAVFGLVAAACAADTEAADEALAEAQAASAAASSAMSEAQAAAAAAADIGAAMAEAQAASASAEAAAAAAAAAAADAAEALAAADLAQATASGNEAAVAEAEVALAEAQDAAAAAGQAASAAQEEAAAAQAEAATAQEEAAAAKAEAEAAQAEAAAAETEARAAEAAAAEAAAAAAGPICGGNTTGDLPQGVDSENGVLKIGTVQPVGGAAVVAGIELLGGIKIAVEEINANGGIDGCMIELIDYNSQYEVEELINQTRRMIDRDGVWGILSPADSRALPGTFDFLAESGVIMWAPISPPFEIERQEVYWLASSRTEQARICVDHFDDLGFTKVATIGATNPLGEEVVAGVEIQAPINGMEIVAQETVESASEIVGPAVLNVIASGAEGIVAGVDNIQNALILQILAENNSDALLCSDQGAAGSGGQNAVGPAEEAADGFLGALQVALPDTDSPLMSQWRALRNAYCDSISDECRAPNFSEQTYLHSITFFEVIDRLEGDLSWDNFHAVAESLWANPIETGAMPPISCGPRADGGHACASGAGLSEYDYETQSWTQIREFQAPKS